MNLDNSATRLTNAGIMKKLKDTQNKSADGFNYINTLDESTECQICLNSFIEPNRELVNLKCGCIYHRV